VVVPTAGIVVDPERDPTGQATAPEDSRQTPELAGRSGFRWRSPPMGIRFAAKLS
jgi:hypothetical protein